MSKKLISNFLLIVFSSLCVFQMTPSVAAPATGSIKVFSEIKGIEIFVDEVSKGVDIVEIKGLTPGQHYVKAVKNGAVIYSELVTVTAGTATAILIKSSEKTKEALLEVMTKEQQEYKDTRLTVNVVGSPMVANPDWKIMQGGVKDVSEAEFAVLTSNEALTKTINNAYERYYNKINVGGIVLLSGLTLGLGGFLTTGDAQIVLWSLGITAFVIGYAMVDTAQPPTGHFLTLPEAVKGTTDYNLTLKKKLGLPEDYEPK